MAAVEEVVRGGSLLLDLRPGACELRIPIGLWSLEVAGRRHEPEHPLVLDTGMAFDLILPLSAFAAVEPSGKTHMETLGGSLRMSMLDVVLTLGARAHRVSALLHPSLPVWILGLPVLSQYDLLMRPTVARGEPILVGPGQG